MLEQFAGQVVIVSGSPGSGKTTTAALLAHLPGSPKVHLHTDDFWGYIKHGLIAPWLPQSHEQNRMISEIAASVAGQYARHGYVVALDGVVRPWWLPAFSRLGLPVHYLVLRTTMETAIARCGARGGDSLADPDVVADLHAQFADLGAFESHAVWVDGLDRDATLAAVVAALQTGGYRLA